MAHTPPSAAVAATVAVVDYLTGEEVHFPIMFALPVILAGWFGRGWFAYALAVMLPAARLVYGSAWHDDETVLWSVVNAAVRTLTLLLVALLVVNTAGQRRRLRVLEGMLSICASCKGIRDEDGKYVRMEKYIVDRSDCSFSHGICPDCAKKMYGEFLD
ncbi:MAG: hypothetical protein JW751_19300 [Polyangiaceae bacterium]|nr:hypothetical protein [Polyangiaceae bacterium]